MKVDIEDGRLIVTPITEEDARIIYALASDCRECVCAGD